MINPSLYDKYFDEGLEAAIDMYGDEETARNMFEKLTNKIFIEDNDNSYSANALLMNYKKKNWIALRRSLSDLQGALSYAGLEKFSDFFKTIKVACDNEQFNIIQSHFPEGMKMLSFIHERILKFLNKEIINVFKVDSSIFVTTNEILQNEIEIYQKATQQQQKMKIFDKELFVSKCDDVMESKFKMYNFIDIFFKNDGYLYKLIACVQENKNDEIKNIMDILMEKIKFFEFQLLEQSINHLLNKDYNLEKSFQNFLEESSNLNKVLKENYSLEDDCIYEYKKNEIDLSKKPSINKEKLEDFSNSAFSKEGKIMNLLKLYEQEKYDLMKDELLHLEKSAKENGLINYETTISFLIKGLSLNQHEDIQKYIKLLCEDSQRTHKYIAENILLKNQIFINYEEYLYKIKRGNDDLSKIPENDNEKFSEEELDKKSNNFIKIKKEYSEIIIKKSKKSEDVENMNVNQDNSQEENNDSLFDKKYKSMKFNVFPGPTIKVLAETNDFQLYCDRDKKNEEYPFDSGLKCKIF